MESGSSDFRTSDMQMHELIIQDHLARRIGNSKQDQLQDEDGIHIGLSTAYNPICGDRIVLRVAFRPGEDSPRCDRSSPNELQSMERFNLVDLDGRVERISWSAQGCSLSQAACSIVTELFAGMELDHYREVAKHFRSVLYREPEVTPDEQILGDAIALTGVAKFPARIKCAMMAWTALEDAIVSAMHTKD